MTDELTPEQEADVRRLLAEARHDEPIPADVAARLDAVLGDLAADDLEVPDFPESPETPGEVHDLAAVRHRRRNAGRLLLAAAAVVVGGVAIGQTIGSTDLGGGDSADSQTAGGVAEAPREADGGDDAGGDAGEDSADQPLPEAAASGATDLLADVDVPLRLSSETFADDVQRELRRTSSARALAATQDFDGLAYADGSDFLACADGPYGEGATLPAYYDAEEAVLVLRRPQAGIQRVEVLACGTATVLNSVDLPAP